MRSLLSLVCLAILFPLTGRATTLPPELKAYDFAEAYYVEDGGVVIAPYDHGFYAPGGVQTPEGVRIMPGGSFLQFNAGKLTCGVYRFTRLRGEQAFFHESLYRYRVAVDSSGKSHRVLGNKIGSDDFYLTEFRGIEWADHVFTNVELHPGENEWRVSKN